MTHADTRAESARIRTILEISAFDLATLEYHLIYHAYVPNSTGEQQIRDATYRFYKASHSDTSQFHISSGRSNIFDPYPYGEPPQHEPKESSGTHAAAAMADRNERESVKYDAVTDLIRMLAERKIRERKSEWTAVPAVKAEQPTVKGLEAQPETKKARTKVLEHQMQVMRTTYAATKLLVGREQAAELREIDKWRYRQLTELAVSPEAAEADEVFQQLAEIEVAKRAKISPGEQNKAGVLQGSMSSGGQNKAGELQGSMWSEAGESAVGVSREMSTAAEDDENDDGEEEQSKISSASAPSTSGKHSKERIRKPRALVRARKAAMEMAAQMENDVAQDLAQASIAESAANFSEKKEGEMQRSMWSAAREGAQDVSRVISMADDVDMSEEHPAASDLDATMKSRRPTMEAQDEKESVQALQLRFQAQIAEKVKAEKMKEAAIQW
jgi:hypothetical protein